MFRLDIAILHAGEALIILQEMLTNRHFSMNKQAKTLSTDSAIKRKVDIILIQIFSHYYILI